MSKVKEKLESVKKYVCDNAGELIVETIVCGCMLAAGYYIGRDSERTQNGETMGLMLAVGDKYPEKFGEFAKKIFAKFTTEDIEFFYKYADKWAESHTDI